MKTLPITLALAMIAATVLAEGDGSKTAPGQTEGHKGLTKNFEGGPGLGEGRKGELGGQRSGENMDQRREEMIEKMLSDSKGASEMGLSEEQIKKLREGLSGLKKKLVELRSDMEKAATDQAELLSGKEIDEEAILKAVDKTGAIRTEIAKTQLKRMLLLRKTIGPEQMEKIKQRLHERMKKEKEEGGGASVAPGQEKLRERIKEIREKRRNDRSEGETTDKVTPATGE